MSTYQILNIRKISEHCALITTERPDVDVRPGQCFSVGIPGMGVNREYSMASNSQSEYLEFLVRGVGDGLVSQRLLESRAGSLLEINGPFGEFCLPEKTHGINFLFVASGTGIAPFHSFVKSVPQLEYTVLHGIRFPDETYEKEVFAEGRYIPCISRNPKGKSLRVTDVLHEYTSLPNLIVYLCGNRHMIVDVTDILRSHGVDGDRIISEVFF